VKIKLSVDTLDGKGPQIVTTNLLTITEWERTERRKISDAQTVQPVHAGNVERMGDAKS
jgi:hypothetical protein